MKTVILNNKFQINLILKRLNTIIELQKNNDKIKNEKIIIINRTNTDISKYEFPKDIQIFNTNDDMPAIIQKILDNYDGKTFTFENMGNTSSFYNVPRVETEIKNMLKAYESSTLFGVKIKPDFDKFSNYYFNKE